MVHFSFTLTALAALFIGADATSVSVIEFGNGGTVQRTTATAPQTVASGVMSFFRSLHEVGSDGEIRRSRTTQYPGMNVVPSIFNRPDGGLSIGITGEAIDMSKMPIVAGILRDEGAVGHFNMKSSEGKILKDMLDAETVESSSLESVIVSKGTAAAVKNGNRLESLELKIESDDSAAMIDESIGKALKEIARLTKESDSTIVVHLFVEENEEIFHNRLQRRRLEDYYAQENANENDDGGQNDNKEEQDGQDADENQYDESQFGYYKKNGVYYNPYRQMKDIQYSNTVMWTAIGLVVILFVANGLMLNMPLLPDTLLFGESAKVVAE
jgi:hypothetical protein